VVDTVMEPDLTNAVYFTDEEILSKISKVVANKKVFTSMEDKDTYEVDGATITTITFKFVKCRVKKK